MSWVSSCDLDMALMCEARLPMSKAVAISLKGGGKRLSARGSVVFAKEGGGSGEASRLLVAWEGQRRRYGEGDRFEGKETSAVRVARVAGPVAGRACSGIPSGPALAGSIRIRDENRQ